MQDKRKILVIMTGGTICSVVDENNENQSDAKRIRSKITNYYINSESPFADAAEFDTVFLSDDVLSENITVDVWNELLEVFRDKEIWSKYLGIIVLHGTDTLAFTSCLLSMVLSGAPIPVCMVSSQLDLSKSATNGYINFKVAVELLFNGIKPNVYVVYRNMINERDAYDSMGKMYVHLGSQVMQCGSYSHNFYSVGAVEIKDIDNAKAEGKEFETNLFLLDKIEKITDNVLLLQSYIGQRYSRLNLDGVKAVLHMTYHSETVCVERKKENLKNDNYSERSVLYLIDICRKKGIPFVLTPCDEKSYTYVSSGDAIRNGALALYGTTVEAAYVKSLIGCSMENLGNSLIDFLKKKINFEFAY